jgi:hypothetical protein
MDTALSYPNIESLQKQNGRPETRSARTRLFCATSYMPFSGAISMALNLMLSPSALPNSSASRSSRRNSSHV